MHLLQMVTLLLKQAEEQTHLHIQQEAVIAQTLPSFMILQRHLYSRVLSTLEQASAEPQQCHTLEQKLQ